MYAQTPILLSVALLALLGSLPRLLEKEEEAAGGGGGGGECPGGGASSSGPGPCALPFLSRNPLTLRCPGALEAEEESLHWQYLNLSQSPGSGSAQTQSPGSPPASPRPRTFIGPRGARAQRGPLTELSGRALVRGGALLVARARPGDSGLYLCRAGAGGSSSGGRTLASYRVDVQDSALLHVSHRGLGQAPLRNQTVRLSGSGASGRRLLLLLHTRWGPWQDCDRCGATGERKRLGFCYAAVAPEEEEEEEEEAQTQAPASPALPCGLMQLRLGQALPRRGPELRYETCRRDCGAAHDAGELANQARELLGDVRAPAAGGRGDVRAPAEGWWLEPRALLLETLLLDLHADARLACPGASVYTPVSWQRDAAPVTRLELLRRCNGTHRLEEATGGGAYRIAGLRRADQGVYRCWVRGRRAAAFHLELPDLPPRRRLHSRRLLGAMRAVVGAFALVFVVSALAELLHSCWCEVL